MLVKVSEEIKLNTFFSYFLLFTKSAAV